MAISQLFDPELGALLPARRGWRLGSFLPRLPMSLRVFFLLGMLIVACTASPASTPSATPSATIHATVAPSPTPAASAPGSFAAVCGTVSDFLGDDPQTSGSFVVNSPGRSPLKITVPAGRLGGSASGYVCTEVLAGAPYPLFDGFFTSGTAGFV